MAVLDTDVLIELGKNNEKVVEKLKELEKNQTLATTILNAEEYLFGLYFLENETAIEKGNALLKKLEIYEYSSFELKSVVDIKLKHRKKGKPIGIYDETIAGICIAHNEELFTLNKKHFSQVEGLKLV